VFLNKATTSNAQKHMYLRIFQSSYTVYTYYLPLESEDVFTSISNAQFVCAMLTKPVRQNLQSITWLQILGNLLKCYCSEFLDPVFFSLNKNSVF
jgi:acetylglutamate synthase